jgi:RNA polymerase sigma-B factor
LTGSNPQRPRQEPTELFRRWRADKDPRAREAIVEMYLPLAHTLAGRYFRSPEPREDLAQVAALALLKAIDRFDPEFGSAFGAFATVTILGELRRHFRDTAWSTHVPRGAQERAMEIHNAIDELSALEGRTPTAQRLADHLGLSLESVLDGLLARNARTATSFETPVRSNGAEESLTVGETIGAEDERLDLVESVVSVQGLIRELPERERRILHLRFVRELSQREIAEQVGISQMQVSRLLREMLDELGQQANPDWSSLELAGETG